MIRHISERLCSLKGNGVEHTMSLYFFFFPVRAAMLLFHKHTTQLHPLTGYSRYVSLERFKICQLTDEASFSSTGP